MSPQPVAQATAKKRRVSGLTGTIDDLRLKGEKFRSQIDQGVLDARLIRSIEGASSVKVTVHDPNLDLLGSRLFKNRFLVELDNLLFSSIGLSYSADNLEITWEDLEVARLREYFGPEKAFRGKVTRAEFIFAQLQKVKPRIPAYILELNKDQPIALPDDASMGEIKDIGGGSAKKGGKGGGGGLGSGHGLTVKGAPASPQQLRNGEIVLSTASELGANGTAQTAVIMACIAETTMINTTGGLDSSVGILQLLAIHGSVEMRRDIPTVVKMFLTAGFTGQGGAMKLSESGMDPAEICATVQGNRDGASTYSPYRNEAEEWVKAFNGGDLPSGGGGTSTSVKPYQFEIKKNETYWDGFGRLAEEVAWRRFVSSGVFYYAAEEDLLKGPPRIVIRHHHHHGIDDFSFDSDGQKPVGEVTLEGRMRTWAAPPGTVVLFDEDVFGPLGGKYLVTSIDSDLLSEQVSITCKRPTPSLPEPAPETVTRSTGDGKSGSSGAGSSAALDDVDLSKGGWEGTEAIMKQVIFPMADDFNVTIGGQKETGHAVGGDHDPNVRNAYACDFGTYTGQKFAEAVCEALGVSTNIIGTFTKATFKCNGKTFGCQVLWNVEDHHDHVHVGIRAGGY